MKCTRTTAAVVFLMLIGLSGAARGDAPTSQPSTATSSKPPAVGEQAKDVSLETPTGETVSLSTLLKDGPVVLIVLRGWPGYQCPVCTRQVGEFVTRGKDIEAAGARVMLVYPGPAEKIKEHAEDFRRGKNLPGNFYFAIDPGYTFTNSYGLRWNARGETAYPATFVVDREGIVRFAHVSHTHGDRASTADVLKALAALK